MPHTRFVNRCFQLPTARIAYLRFILEGYDGLAFMRTLDPGRGLVEIGYPLLRRRDAEDLLGALGAEIGLTEILRSDDYRPL